MIVTQDKSIILPASTFQGARLPAPKASTALKSEVVLKKAIRRSIKAVNNGNLSLLAKTAPQKARLYVRHKNKHPIGFNLVAVGRICLSESNELIFSTLSSRAIRLPQQQIAIVPNSFFAHYKKSFSAVLSKEQIATSLKKATKQTTNIESQNCYFSACKSFFKELTKTGLQRSLPINSKIALLNIHQNSVNIACFGKVEDSSNKSITFTWERWTQDSAEKESIKALKKGKLGRLVVVPIAYLGRELIPSF